MPTEWLLNKDSHYANSMGKKRDKLRSNLYDLNSPYKVNQFALLDDLLVKKNDAKSIGRWTKHYNKIAAQYIMQKLSLPLTRYTFCI